MITLATIILLLLLAAGIHADHRPAPSTSGGWLGFLESAA